MQDVLEQSRGHEPHDDNAAGHHPGAGEPIEPQGQKCQRRGQVAEHRDPVIGRAVDHPIQGAEQNSLKRRTKGLAAVVVDDDSLNPSRTCGFRRLVREEGGFPGFLPPRHPASKAAAQSPRSHPALGLRATQCHANARRPLPDYRWAHHDLPPPHCAKQNPETPPRPARTRTPPTASSPNHLPPPNRNLCLHNLP
jgi:hypothetical protein